MNLFITPRHRAGPATPSLNRVLRLGLLNRQDVVPILLEVLLTTLDEDPQQITIDLLHETLVAILHRLHEADPRTLRLTRKRGPRTVGTDEAVAEAAAEAAAEGVVVMQRVPPHGILVEEAEAEEAAGEEPL